MILLLFVYASDICLTVKAKTFFGCWVWNTPAKLGQYHDSWWPGTFFFLRACCTGPAYTTIIWVYDCRIPLFLMNNNGMRRMSYYVLIYQSTHRKQSVQIYCFVDWASYMICLSMALFLAALYHSAWFVLETHCAILVISKVRSQMSIYSVNACTTLHCLFTYIVGLKDKSICIPRMFII